VNHGIKLIRRVKNANFTIGVQVPGNVRTGIDAKTQDMDLWLTDLGILGVSRKGVFEALYPLGIVSAAILEPMEENQVEQEPKRRAAN
jgi:hypothetical protein